MELKKALGGGAVADDLMDQNMASSSALVQQEDHQVLQMSGQSEQVMNKCQGIVDGLLHLCAER